MKELKEFYSSKDQNNKYIKKAKEDFISAFHTQMKNQNWYKNIICSKSLQEKQERVKKIRERNQRLREYKREYSPSEYTSTNAKAYNTTKHVSNNSMSLAFYFSSAVNKHYNEPFENKKNKIEENKQTKKRNFLRK